MDKEQAVTELSGLIWFWANKYAQPHIPADDLYSEGIVGLMAACDKFVPGGCEFKTYATWLIRGHMLDYRRRNRGVMRSPRDEDPTVVDSIDFKISEHDTVADTIPMDFCLSTTVCNDIVAKQAVDMLKPKEAKVIDGYYYKQQGMKEIGNDMGISESRVSQIHTQAIKHMRESLGV